MIVLAALALLSAPLPYVLVLKDGTRIDARTPEKAKGSVGVFTLPNGRLTSVPLESIDRPATTTANLKPMPGPTAAPVAAVASGNSRGVVISNTGGAGPVMASGGAPSIAQTGPGSGPTTSPTSGQAASSGSGRVAVRGYTRADGTYVAPHTRAAPHSLGSGSGSSSGGHSGGHGGGKH